MFRCRVAVLLISKIGFDSSLVSDYVHNARFTHTLRCAAEWNGYCCSWPHQHLDPIPSEHLEGYVKLMYWTETASRKYPQDPVSHPQLRDASSIVKMRM